MNSKNNRLNHDFQISHFLAGSCHTADGAWSLLYDLREDRQAALAANEAHVLRQQATRVRAMRDLDSDDEAKHLEAKAAIAEIDGQQVTHEKNVAGAQAELATIERCMTELQPQRRFAHLSDAQAHEAAQPEEWRLELMHRAQNQLLSAGTLSPDLLGTMRMHPAFGEMFSALERLAEMLRTGNRDQVVRQLLTMPLLEGTAAPLKAAP